MDIQHKRFLIGGISVLAIVLVAVFFFALFRTDTQEEQMVVNQEVSMDDPIDIVLDFYDKWLSAAQSTSTNPYQSELAMYPLLSSALRTKLEEGRGQDVPQLDPVLCQTKVPERIIAKVIFTLEEKAQILIKSKDKTVTEQAVVTLKRLNEGWYIDDIMCSPGEFEPAREFSFEREGHLLKSVPPPLDPQYWYIVFEENGEQGHFAPLFFNGESTCVSASGDETVCNLEQFVDAMKVRVYGQMSELGVEVKRIEFAE